VKTTHEPSGERKPRSGFFGSSGALAFEMPLPSMMKRLRL
jgi:hypothetical protein